MRVQVLRPALLVVLTAGLAGCSLGSNEFNDNRVDPSATQQPVVRTPSPLGTDLPYTQPPILQPLPGPSGGVPGEVPVEVPPASPGGGRGATGPAN